MKKLLSLLLATLSTIILVSCASQDKLDGDYYQIDTENGLRNELSFSIKGTESTIDKEEYDKFTINSKNNTFELSGEDASAKEVTYKHSDGVITVDIIGTEHDYYLKGTDAYEEALKKYNELQNSGGQSSWKSAKKFMTIYLISSKTQKSESKRMFFILIIQNNYQLSVIIYTNSARLKS